MKVTGREGRGGNFFSECERSVDTNVRRGDIYYADLSPVVGSEQGGVRPVLIIQNDTGNRYSPTVIAAAITSQTNKAKLPTHIALSAPDHGLPRDSVVLLEQVRTLDKRHLRERMGRVDGELMERIDAAIAVSFGLGNTQLIWKGPKEGGGVSSSFAAAFAATYPLHKRKGRYIMKKTPHALTRLFTLLLASLTILSISVAAAGTAGSSSDPLVTLSYLNEKFLPELMTRVDEKLAARTDTASKELRAQVDADIKRLEEKYGSQTSNEGASTGTADSFVVVTMTNGQVLYGAIGCEVMLRVGTASVVSPSSPGLIDSTGGTTLDNGAGLTKNHLYMMTISDRGVKATAATTKLLVRGTYEVK